MTLELFITIVAVFGTVALGAGLLMQFALTQSAPERRRLQRAGQVTATGVLIEGPSLDPEPSPFVKKAVTLVPRSPKDMSSLRRQLVRAGYYTMTPVAVYTIAQLVCPIVLGLVPFTFLPANQAWILAGIFAVLGYLLPGLILGRLITKRQKVIQNGLPDALDLMIVCLEAGSALDQAILKVSDELELAYPALAEELRLVITETRAGKPRLEAFRNLASRTGVEDVRSLVAMLVQTDKFGTSVSQALRTHAEVSRTKRRQRAEERAAKIGVKLVFPLVFCLFPAFFVVTLGPAVIKFMRVMFGQILGQ
ncbi:MAG TPA: type II secretion system F family protein [Vicinamibacterales bacterium]|nr:type II secretion system F family protein [Vicinamibacterales bacterium]